MDHAGAIISVELDDASLDALLVAGGAAGRKGGSGNY